MTVVYAALEHRFTISGTGPGRELLERVLSPLRTDDVEPVVTTYQLEIDGDRATARRDGRALHTGPVARTASLLMTSINSRATASVDHLAVHAAVVANSSIAIILPGSSGAGKSTIAAALTDAGYRYLSDETAPITEQHVVVPYTKPIVVGSRSFDVLGAAIGRADLARRGDRWFLDPRLLSGGPALTPMIAGLVVVPEFRPGFTVDVVPLSRSEVAAAVAGNTFNLDKLRRSGLERAVDLARSLPGYRLVHGGVEHSVGAIRELSPP
jgi:hypothetical protein